MTKSNDSEVEECKHMVACKGMCLPCVNELIDKARRPLLSFIFGVGECKECKDGFCSKHYNEYLAIEFIWGEIK